MTNTPGDGQTPEDPYGARSRGGSGDSGDSGGQEQPGYWEQQGQPGQASYAQQHGQQYGQQYGGPAYPADAPMQYAPDHPRATTVLVLGILGIVVCGVIAPFAWAMGKRTVDEIDASQGTLGGRGAANAGYILGIIGTILLGIAVLALLGMFALFGLAAVSSSGY